MVPPVPTDPTLTALLAAPAWTNGARVALEAHRDALAAGLRDTPARRTPLALRAAELSLGAGGYQAAEHLRRLIDPDLLDAGERERLAFLDARITAALPDLPTPPTPSVQGLARLRAETVRAETAFFHGRLPEAAAAWEAALAVDADGPDADELRYVARVALARLLLLGGRDPSQAHGLLEGAATLARDRGSPHDEAGVLLWIYEALTRLGNADELARLGARAASLPRVDVGGLPAHLTHHLEAAALARDGALEPAIRALEEGIREIDPTREPSGWAALVVAKATVLEAAARDEDAFRLLLLARTRLKRAGATREALLLVPPLDHLRHRAGEDAWAAWFARLQDTVRRDGAS